MGNKKITASFVSLGCFKNTVDTEVLGGLLEKYNIKVISSYENPDWLIINTCGFVRDAKEESINEIYSGLEKKESGEIKHLAVFGCLIQRYQREFKESFKKVDILWGVNDIEQLARQIFENNPAEYQDKGLFLYNDKHKRILTTAGNSTFIKISEGCSQKCSFCAIPSIRGKYRSRKIESIIKEAESCIKNGVEELNLISQNTTCFGRDFNNRFLLPDLLDKIAKIGFKWIRLLYLMPEEIDDRILAAFKNPGILPYFDLPFQHAAPALLKKMNRSANLKQKADLIKKIRSDFENPVIRSSFIVGFPGETKEDFEQLGEFAQKWEIERIGVFAYSDEDGTESFKLEPKIPPELIKERQEKLLDISDDNIKNFNESLVGTTQEFLPLGPSPWNSAATIGRLKSQAPQVDGLTQINSKFNNRYRIIKIRITGFEKEILYGEKS